MSKNLRLATLIFTFLFILIVIIYVATKFFTNDKYYAPIATIEENTFSNNNEIMEIIISPKAISSLKSAEQGDLQDTNENETIKNKNIDDSENTKHISSTSRSSTEIKSSKPEIQEVTQTTNEEIFSSNNDISEEDDVILESSTTEDIKVQSFSDSIGTIYIPKTGINLPILKNVTASGMETAVCFLYSTGSLNKSGTTLIVGHNYRNGKLFSNNKNLQIGDSIYVTSSDGNQIHYTIYEKFITDETDLSYLNKNTTGEAQIALSTCTDNDIDRLVILAK